MDYFNIAVAAEGKEADFLYKCTVVRLLTFDGYQFKTRSEWGWWAVCGSREDYVLCTF